MYPPKLFFSDDLDVALAIAEAARFATVSYIADDLPQAVFLPFVVDREGEAPRLIAHLLKSNPLHARLAEGPVTARLVFHAGDAYVSPSVYAEKAISGKVVPTWNYVASQFLVDIERVAESDLEGLLARQVSAFEGDVGSDWALSDAPADYRAGLMRMIAGLCCTIREARAHKKLSQNKAGERANIIAWLTARGSASARLARWMEED